MAYPCPENCRVWDGTAALSRMRASIRTFTGKMEILAWSWNFPEAMWEMRTKRSRSGTVARGSYVYDTVKDENRYTLDQVPPRYFSEIILQLARATASSQEQLAYPECRQ